MDGGWKAGTPHQGQPDIILYENHMLYNSAYIAVPGSDVTVLSYDNHYAKRISHILRSIQQTSLVHSNVKETIKKNYVALQD